MKRTILLLISILSLLPAFSCDYNKQSFLWWYFKSDLIFTGKVIQVFESDSSSYDVKFLVDRVYKGDKQDTLRLTVNSYHEGNMTISDCDVYLKPDEKYLVYARKSGERYFTGGQESRTGLEIYHQNDCKWLESIDCKVTDFYWDWDERDVKPVPENIDSIIHSNFNLNTRDTSAVHGNLAFVLCNIDEHGTLTKANLFYYRKGQNIKRNRIIYEKYEHLNPEVECFTDFQREAVRVTRLIKKWTPSIFCGKKVKGQALIKYDCETEKLNIELTN